MHDGIADRTKGGPRVRDAHATAVRPESARTGSAHTGRQGPDRPGRRAGSFLSPRTVHSHIGHLLRKTGCASRAEATALAVRDGVLRRHPLSERVALVRGGWA
ncbi:LuxR C-terminal-related transcriptional regulator [Streptomyces sp. NPDC047461]|uniref:LuxR C-terminal-related transcriptional regulator n=1 Tax=Streptomyces sp. NPDC047461 TaxID=3155619 RepID=UPI0033FE9407